MESDASRKSNAQAKIELLEKGNTQAKIKELGIGLNRRAWTEHKQVVLTDNFNELVRRGIPTQWRMRLWMEITSASEVQNLVRKDEKDYQTLAEYGKAWKSDAMLQLHEDTVKPYTWEAPDGAGRELHLKRLGRAVDVCVALIAVSQEWEKDRPKELVYNFKDEKVDNTKKGFFAGAEPCGVAYCESLLIVAYFLLVAQTPERDAMKDNRNQERDIEEETRVFWLLYTLICSRCNQAYRGYYGTAGPAELLKGGTNNNDNNSPPNARRDVLRLSCCVLRYEPEIWVHLNAVGFQFPVLFHGIFMRLFAFVLPTSSLFRFWDVLFAESTQGTSNKPATHALIDLAFAGIKRCKERLLQCKNSAEVQSCIINYFEHLYDPSQVIEMVTEAEEYLWEGIFQKVSSHQISPFHGRDADQVEANFVEYYKENLVFETLQQMKDFICSCDCTERPQRAVGNLSATDTRIITKNLFQCVIPTLQREMPVGPVAKFGGIQRSFPRKIFEQGAPTDNSWKSKLHRVGTGIYRYLFDDNSQYAPTVRTPVPYCGEPRENQIRKGEPSELTVQEFQSVVRNTFGDKWGKKMLDGQKGLAMCFKERAAFAGASPESQQMSLTEFFITLICASRGTVGDKAYGFFDLFSYSQKTPKMYHIAPCFAAHTVVDKIERVTDDGESHALTDEEIQRKVSILFNVFVDTNGSNKTDKPFGEAYITSLQPYVQHTNDFYGAGADDLGAASLSIFSTEEGSSARARNSIDTGTTGNSESKSTKLWRGTMKIVIIWRPTRESRYRGELFLRLKSVEFGPTTNAPETLNPRITVQLLKGGGQKQQIDRCDPRGIGAHIANAATAGIAYQGSYGVKMEFPATMWYGLTGRLTPMYTQGEHGWISNKDNGADKPRGEWKWNNKYGEQRSAHDIEVRPEALDDKGKQSDESISIEACRLITHTILSRGIHFITNRQSALIADQIFGRSGVTPAILDALLMKQSTFDTHMQSSFTDMKDRVEKENGYVDVKQQVVLWLEELISKYGCTSQCPQALSAHKFVFDGLDPFPGQKKILVIRYVRTGDGERGIQRIPVSPDGMELQQLPENVLVPLDMTIANGASKVQMAVTRREFVACVMNSPLLSETLRHFPTMDSTFKNDLKSPPKQPFLNLSVTITDPTQKDMEAEMFDVMDVRQSILLEVWDYDVVSRHDFLGECWLPPLNSIGPEKRAVVLPLRAAPEGTNETKTPIGDKNTSQKEITGHLFVEASWKFPIQEVDPGTATDVQQRMQLEDTLHTGELKLQIVRAENVRSSDLKAKGSDPFVKVWRRNDAYGLSPPKWHHLFDTKSIRANLNPVWNKDETLKIMTGGHEKKREENTHYRVQTLSFEQQFKSGDELTVDFPDKDTQNAVTGTKIYMGDTMNEFKVKLAKRCREKAQKAQGPMREKWNTTAGLISSKYIVTVFQPSDQLRAVQQRSGASSKEFTRKWTEEITSPSNWEPLVDSCTFEHYAKTYGFDNQKIPQQLRVALGDDMYAMRNSRYRAFLQRQRTQNMQVEDMDDSNSCYGFARYKHSADSNSEEWRPAIIERSSRGFQVNWPYHTTGIRELDEHEVLIAPVNAKIHEPTEFMHQELLRRVPDLAKTKTEQEIVETLNKELDSDWQYHVQSAPEGANLERPRPITLSAVKNKLANAQPS